MGRPSILFFARNPHNVVAYLPVLRALANDPRVKLRLTSKNEHTSPCNAVFDGFGLPRNLLVHHRIASLMKYDLYLSPDMYLLSRRSKTKVHTFHGISIKGHAFSEKALAYDKLFLIGPYQRKRFAKLGILPEDDARFVEIGMPKTDALLNGLLSREKFLSDLKLDPAHPTILYAPTWRPEASLYTLGEDLIRLMRNAPFNFLIKLHDLSLNLKTNRINWRANLDELAAPNIRALWDRDITPALHASDLLISDASSAANEFALLDRPIVFADVPQLFKKYGDTVDLDDWGQSSGEVATDATGIMRAIERSLADPTLHAEKRRQIAHEGFYNPGHATEAALREIYNLLSITN